MPNFNRPFCCGTVALKSNALRTAIQQSISDEYEAASRYREIAEACDNEYVKALFFDIAKEEIVHVGEFTALLNRLFPDDAELVKGGMKESENVISAEDEAGLPEGAEQPEQKRDDDTEAEALPPAEVEKLKSEIVGKKNDDAPKAAKAYLDAVKVLDVMSKLTAEAAVKDALIEAANALNRAHNFAWNDDGTPNVKMQNAVLRNMTEAESLLESAIVNDEKNLVRFKGTAKRLFENLEKELLK